MQRINQQRYVLRGIALFYCIGSSSYTIKALRYGGTLRAYGILPAKPAALGARVSFLKRQKELL